MRVKVKKTPGDTHTPASLYTRCPSWSPGNELKCVGEKGHEGLCHATRMHCDKGKITWMRAPEAVADEVVADEAIVEAPTATPTEE